MTCSPWVATALRGVAGVDGNFHYTRVHALSPNAGVSMHMLQPTIDFPHGTTTLP